jgi:hypothetical protein
LKSRRLRNAVVTIRPWFGDGLTVTLCLAGAFVRSGTISLALFVEGGFLFYMLLIDPTDPLDLAYTSTVGTALVAVAAVGPKIAAKPAGGM